MKRCKRCYSIIEKSSTHCSSCGLEVNFKNIYYTNENNKKVNYTLNSYKQNNKADNKRIAIFFAIFYIFLFIIGIIISVTDEKIYEESKFYFDIDNVEDYLYSTKLITEDYYKIWTLSLTNNITINTIVNNTSLTYHNLNNTYCNALNINPTIHNALNCVKKAYIDNGTHAKAFNELEELKIVLEEADLKDNEYEIIYNIYLNSINLYTSIEEENSYDEFEEKYNLAILEIEFLLQKIKNKTL